MSSKWFDFDDDVASGFFDKTRLEYMKKNVGINSKRVQKSENWSAASEVNDVLDLAASNWDSQRKAKLIDSLLKERLAGRSTIDRASRFAEDPSRLHHLYADDFFSDVDERVNKIRSRWTSERCGAQDKRSERFEKPKDQKSAGFPEKSPSCASANSYAFSDVTSEVNRARKDSVDSSWSRKSCQGNVTFPTSSASTLSDACGTYSNKTIGRSVSRDSDDSVCTEKSVNSSAIAEKLPDGTDKTQIESNESWLRKSTSGSKIAEKKVNDVTTTEKNDDGTCEKSTTRMSYLEKSATGSSLQEEMTSQKMTSSSKGGIKTVEQKTSSETLKKSSHRRPSSSKSTYYDDLESSAFDRFMPSSFSKDCHGDRVKAPAAREKGFFRPGRTSLVSEKISKLIDEAVQQDDLFKIPSSLQTDIDKMTDDFFNSQSLRRERTSRINRKRLGDLFSEGTKDESYASCSKLSELRSENESLQQENLKLQSIIQDVTAVNKRWQKYNNERRLYVQKLLSTIQDLQEQINLISEKSAFQSKSQEEVCSQLAEIELLKKEHQEHITVLELQIKSHKDDWEAERKEKRKALEEREELQGKVEELTRDVNFLRGVLQEDRQRKNIVCMMCNEKLDQDEMFQRMEFCSAPLKVPNCSKTKFCSAVNIPYDTTDISNEECFCTSGNLLEEDGASSPDHNSYFSTRNEPSESFTRTTKCKKSSLASDTITVEDESGIRLSITEQFPSKDGNLKSILKKNVKKTKVATKTFSGQTDSNDGSISPLNRICIDKPNITCQEFDSTDSNDYGLALGFQEGSLARVTSFSPDSVNNAGHYLSTGTTQLLNVNVQDSRSKSEPNTRSNSSENLKPLRESSSWNSESFGGDPNARESIICQSCSRAFPSSMHHKFVDHFEICQSENNQF